MVSFLLGLFLKSWNDKYDKQFMAQFMSDHSHTADTFKLEDFTNKHFMLLDIKPQQDVRLLTKSDPSKCVFWHLAVSHDGLKKLPKS